MVKANPFTDHKKVIQLQNRIIDEIFFAFGMSRSGWARKLFGPMFLWPARHFAFIVAKYQAMVPEIGFGLTARKALPEFNAHVNVTGLELVPKIGPLIIASNHVGGVDTLAVASCFPRKDMKIMVSDIGFLRTMSVAEDYFILVPTDPSGRMIALQEAISHLQGGGSVLVFAHGEVEPDPELMPCASESIEEWSPSLEIMLRKVPLAQLQISIVSGLIQPAFMRNPIIRLRRPLFARQKLAEFIQIMQQMVFPKSVHSEVHISLSKPLSQSDFVGERIMPAIIRAGQSLLAEHIERFKIKGYWVKTINGKGEAERSLPVGS